MLLVGCGKMGGALLDGWLAARTVDHVVVVEPQGAFPADAGAAGQRIVRCAGVSRIPPGFDPDVVVIAVKPQVMDEVVPGYAGFVRPGTVFLSIAAGKTIDYFTARLGADAAIVRAMPNTPASVGRGMTVAVPNAAVTPEQRRLCETLMGAVGQVAWVEDESMMDAVTAVSGGGPAYVFLLIETLAKAGVAAGLPEDLAMKIARATVAGSGELAARSIEPAASLRKNVTSPNGTTQAALEVLMADDGIQPLVDRAIAAATARSRELAS
ncbi:pyrroline-5-carboxylate reductase [Skermanella aerolata]|uniref:Pyrroline-5-carboxylate reductase n=1 Tax=Skermanella aerolata TaxID=393310 RepID=A0A512DR91_9PROT|nr:pyrroline-5-carboxylate reductase [Skermanella aerolata]